MSWVKTALCVALGAGLMATYVSPANARDRDRDRWHSDRENRRDARRAGVVSGLIVAGAVSSARHQNAEQRYRECMFSSGYDYACERRLYEDERRARQSARRAGVTAGIITGAIVRD